MYGNQASAKDLFVANPGQLLGNRFEGNDSAFSSSSSSQYPFSQRSGPHSQDYSQQFTQQGNESPGANFYNKYKAMSPLFSNDNNPYTCRASAPPKLTYQQQLQINKAKARERDERDLLDSIVTTVRECTQEVTVTVTSMKKDIHHGISANEEKVAEVLEKIKTEMNKNCEQLMKVLEERDQEKGKLRDMEKNLAVKDAMIGQLQDDLEKLRLQKEDNIVTSLKQTYAEQQELNRQQIHQLHQAQVKQIEAHTRKQRDQQALIEGQEKQHQQLRSESRRQIQDLEHKISQELNSQQQQVENLMKETAESYHQLLESKHQQQKEGLEQWFVQQMRGKTQKGDSDLQELQRSQEEKLVQLQNQQRHEVEAYIQQQLTKMNLEKEKQYADQMKQFECGLEKDKNNLQDQINQHLAQHKHQQQQQHHWYERKLQDMQKRHEEEIKRLEQQMQDQVHRLDFEERRSTQRQTRSTSSPFPPPALSTNPYEQNLQSTRLGVPKESSMSIFNSRKQNVAPFSTDPYMFSDRPSAVQPTGASNHGTYSMYQSHAAEALVSMPEQQALLPTQAQGTLTYVRQQDVHLKQVPGIHTTSSSTTAVTGWSQQHQSAGTFTMPSTAAAAAANTAWLQKQQSSFVSPVQSSRGSTLLGPFTRNSTFSPVATVLPQRQADSSTNQTKEIHTSEVQPIGDSGESQNLALTTSEEQDHVEETTEVESETVRNSKGRKCKSKNSKGRGRPRKQQKKKSELDIIVKENSHLVIGSRLRNRGTTPKSNISGGGGSKAGKQQKVIQDHKDSKINKLQQSKATSSNETASKKGMKSVTKSPIKTHGKSYSSPLSTTTRKTQNPQSIYDFNDEQSCSSRDSSPGISILGVFPASYRGLSAVKTEKRTPACPNIDDDLFQNGFETNQNVDDIFGTGASVQRIDMAKRRKLCDDWIDSEVLAIKQQISMHRQGTPAMQQGPERKM